MKNFKSNINYFKKWEGMATFGLCVMVVGFVLLWMGYGLTYFLGGALIIGGFTIFIMGNSGRSNEGEIMEEIKRRTEGIEFSEVEKDHYFHKRVPAKEEIMDFAGFVLRDGLMLKKMKNGSVCSSEYRLVRAYLLTDAFYVKSRNISLVSEEESNVTEEIPFSAVEDIKVERDRQTLGFEKKQFSVSICNIAIVYDGGKTFLLPAKDDAYVDDVAAKLKKIADEGKTA